MNPDWQYEEPDPADLDDLESLQDTRAADDADAHRKGEN